MTTARHPTDRVDIVDAESTTKEEAVRAQRMGSGLAIAVAAIWAGACGGSGGDDGGPLPGDGGTAAGPGTGAAPGQGGSPGRGGSSGMGGSPGTGNAPGCQTDADCAAALPQTDPPGCATGSCQSGSCLFKAKDSDGDTYAAANCRSLGSVSVEAGLDCDDADADVYPGASEQCNDKDDDCDGLTDNDIPPSSESCSRPERPAGADPDVEEMCQQTGNKTCVAGEWSGCTAAAKQPEPDSPTCDGKSYDCDFVANTGCGCTSGQTEACTTTDGKSCPGMRSCSAGQWSECTATGTCVCANGATEGCTTTNPAGCSGTRTCTNNQWGACNPSGTCVCGTGQSQSCTAQFGCPGVQTCSNGNWGTCNPTVTCQCSSGATQGCSGNLGCPGSQTCTNYQWGGCGCLGSWFCQPGTTRGCKTSQNCDGTQSCSQSGNNSNWGTCVGPSACPPGWAYTTASGIAPCVWRAPQEQALVRWDQEWCPDNSWCPGVDGTSNPRSLSYPLNGGSNALYVEVRLAQEGSGCLSDGAEATWVGCVGPGNTMEWGRKVRNSEYRDGVTIPLRCKPGERVGAYKYTWGFLWAQRCKRQFTIAQARNHDPADRICGW
jgi:hypothetical protein